MDFVLVFPVILVVLSSGQSLNSNTNSCYVSCPAGYHKIAQCAKPASEYKCKRCEIGTYTEFKNHIDKCLKCAKCNHFEKIIKPCNFTRNVECGCVEGYYYQGLRSSERYCQPCKPDYSYPDYNNKCQPCRRVECLNNSECRRVCTATTVPPPTLNRTSNPFMESFSQNTVNYLPWLVLCVVVMTFLVLFGLLLFFTRNSSGKPNRCLQRSTSKEEGPHAEDPRFKEQHSHQGSSPTTLTFNITEETPMMALSHCPATSQHPAQICPLRPNAEYKAARQDGPSESAVVLYAIIKEVPLRRWKEFLRLLALSDQQLERVELEAGLDSMERQYQMLRLWSQRSSASLDDVFSALHCMDLSGCAQLLQESLERLQRRPEPK
ncbi:tumor necrosis factor receptor superfamily member 1A isoform X1 [Scophthalmus maximus]|uniref:tumor necrosis factor receptor superfamily member 1A isoform X1 n=1 Tax=Scophthalmus maximus TaxID=52904 RepID=UPI001FA836BA|nr:tumor necrosis factor receptor superfamily member 1A isoform X1 [Scophthalmus maximus]